MNNTRPSTVITFITPSLILKSPCVPRLHWSPRVPDSRYLLMVSLSIIPFRSPIFSYILLFRSATQPSPGSSNLLRGSRRPRLEYLVLKSTKRDIRLWLRISVLLCLPRFTIKLDRLIVLSESSILGWFLQVSLIVIIKGRSPMEVSFIVIIKQVSSWLSLIIKLFHHFSPNLSNSAHDSLDQTGDMIQIKYNPQSSHPSKFPPDSTVTS